MALKIATAPMKSCQLGSQPSDCGRSDMIRLEENSDQTRTSVQARIPCVLIVLIFYGRMKKEKTWRKRWRDYYSRVQNILLLCFRLSDLSIQVGDPDHPVPPPITGCIRRHQCPLRQSWRPQLPLLGCTHRLITRLVLRALIP
jgi:hypothetical protein